MEEPNEQVNVVPELYFLIAKFLSGGPLKETAKVLPRRLDWEGNEHAQSYDELAAQYSDVSWTRLATVCERALQLASYNGTIYGNTVTTTASNAITNSPNTSTSNSDNSAVSVSTSPVTTSCNGGNDHQRLQLRARLSLLSESLVRPKPQSSVYKQDNTLGE
ncbi:unnamed protein product [Parnassius mnemosyne]|uniref:BRWD/PHIP N-terminal domain-containing protein n=1 Tax=Parnassius mnemosyne TaxID=213953 RepID=A0AAV1LWU6_9NEOP